MKRIFLKILAWKLKILAKLTLGKYNPQIIGITGSVGKTSTKEAIQTVLSSAKKVRAGSKNFNNEWGLPLVILGDWSDTEGRLFLVKLFVWSRIFIKSIWQLIFRNPNYPEVLVLEYGIDKPGDMNYLLSIARPQIGVITAIGEIPVHVEFFTGAEAVAREKEKLTNNLPATGFAILNADDEDVLDMKSRTRANVITYGWNEKADVRITNFEENFSAGGEDGFGGISFKLNYGGSFIPIKLLGVFGKTQAYAASVSAVVGLILGMNLVKISESLTRYRSPSGRLKIIQGIKKTVLIDDTYNASPLSMREALETLGRLKSKRKVAVLGDMLEIGKYTLEAHESIGRVVAKNADVLITVGGRAKFIAEGAIKAGMKKNSISVFGNVGEAGLSLQDKMRVGDLVLVKGSQGVRMEKIVKEVMANPEEAKSLLVRQSPVWQKKKGLYDY